MKTQDKKIVLGLNLVSAMFLGTNAFAGQIVTDAPEGEALKTAVSTPNKQFGFGGWDLSNVSVNIVSTEDYSVTGSFNPADGTYTDMVYGDTFESVLTTGGEVRGLLHGKDWPTGEPSGIKIINGDMETKKGKPENCILTTSYIETGPVLCSSGFQTHKRFKINLQPSTVAGGIGLPVEISFNLKDGDTSTQRYQVLQKINNYTGKRLNGYSIEVFDANGLSNPELTVSLGIGENPGKGDEPPTDIWNTESMANFSHGLWGPTDHHFDANGFFDLTRSYYTPIAGANSISYAGPMLGGNYQSIFGNWLPSIWEPTGVFHDDDMDPSTDGTLKAFWGDPLKLGTNSWHKGNDDNWELATEADLLLWTGDWYEQGAIEDVLNLGVNYIINVGDNTAIGNKFTIRITPSVDPDQSEPSYVADVAPEPSYDSSEGIVVVGLQLVPEEEDTATDDTATEDTATDDTATDDTATEDTATDDIATDDTATDDTATEDTATDDTATDDTATDDTATDDTASARVVLAKAIATPTPILASEGIIAVGVADNDLNVDTMVKETVEVIVTSDHGETETLVLTESDVNTSRFVGSLKVSLSDDNMKDNDGKFLLNKHTNLKAVYIDHKYGSQKTPETLESVLAIEVPEASEDTGGGSSSFDAYDSKSFLMMLFGFLGMGGLIARRRLAKKG